MMAASFGTSDAPPLCCWVFQFAAEYTKDHLITALKAKLVELHAQRAPPAEPTEPAEGTAVPGDRLAAPAPLHPVASAPAQLVTGPQQQQQQQSPPPPSIIVQPPPEPAAAYDPAETSAAPSSRSHEAYHRPRAPRRVESARISSQGDMLVNFLGEINYTRVLQEVFSEVDDRLLDAARREANIAGGCRAAAQSNTSAAWLEMCCKKSSHVVSGYMYERMCG